MADTTADSWQTTVHVRNIHCTSCIAHIYRLLADLGDEVLHVDTSINDHKIEVTHRKDLSASRICHILSDAAFEVDNAATLNERGVKVLELGGNDEGDAWLEVATAFWRQPTQAPAGLSDGHCLPRFDTLRRDTHFANCDACRKASVTSSTAHLVEQSKGKGQVDADEKSVLEDQAEQGMRQRTDMKRGDSHLPGDNHKAAAKLKQYEAHLSIGGMTCASCTSAISKGLNELPGITSANLNLMTNSAIVEFTGEETLGNIFECIDDLGYDCTLDKNTVIGDERKRIDCDTERLVVLKIEGMFCHHCPRQVLEALKTKYPDEVTIETTPTLEEPFLKLSYVPHGLDLTIRNIVATIDSVNVAFSTSVYVPPSIEQKSQTLQKREQRRLLIRLVFTFFIALPTLLIGVVWMSLVSEDNSVRRFFELASPGQATGFDWALFILATPVFFLAADVFHVRSIKEIRALWRSGSRVPIFQRFYRFGSMNLLVSLGTAIAYFASIAVLAIDASTHVASRLEHSSSTYFDSVVFLTFFILIGRWLEAYSKAKTGDAVGMLGDLRPREATLVTAGEKSSTTSVGRNTSNDDNIRNHATERIDAKLLEVGDLVVVSHGSSPPADGIVVEGSSKFNESSLTGESGAIARTKGDKVFSGAINVGDPIYVQVTDIVGTSMLDQIVSVVREGQTRRAPVERVVDVITGYFVPVITALAIVTWIVWLTLGFSGVLYSIVGDPGQGGWAFWSLEFAIAVFVVACPCGIGLAAPTALYVGSGLAASHGILVRGGGEAFQEASTIDAVVFDKTGTLTEGGNLKVTDHQMLAEDEEAIIAWSIAKALEENSSHPMARAILELALAKHSKTINQISISEEPGHGLRGSFTTSSATDNDVTYEAALGNEALIESLTPKPESLTYFTETTLSAWKTRSKSVALLAIRKISDPSSANPWTIITLFAIADPIRSSAIPTLAHLRALNIPTYILTGDNPTTALAVASTLSVPADHVFAGVLPTEKASKIRWLQDHGPKRQSASSWFASNERKAKATVAFVGDGINDAPALTAADVSISLSGASDIALHSASFVLLSSSLDNIITLFALSERVFRRVKLNFAWAIVYNLVLIPVAAGCFFRVKEGGWRFSPVWGSAAMALSSVTVVLSSASLRWEGSVVGWVKGLFRGKERGGSEGLET
ncbi:hypothetical protein MMC21_004418 [Puttea exsequens]|nr:hypothetical protein [Puttea exsequens]